MIGSFWNLCRACPSMPVDKLHSEYRSTYRWHEYTGNNRPEVVRKPPVPNQFASSTEHFFSKSMEDEKSVEGPINEPPLPRRKKCPELAYRTHDFITGSDAPTATNLRSDVTRARSEERGTPSRRSKSEGPPGLPNGRAYPYERDVAAKANGVVPEKAAKAYELEPLVNDAEERRPVQKPAAGFSSSENRASTRPFSQMIDQDRQNHFLTRKENFGFSDNHEAANETATVVDGKTMVNGTNYDKEWYKEVIELRKKAGEYKCRGWGVGVDPELYKKQKDLWDQVSRRSSLSALSLASSVHRPITKEEKEQENNKKTSPTKQSRGKVPGHSQLVDNKTVPDGPILPARVQSIRHHLERTTGPDVEEGALLPSPTREKLMPTIPKSKESEPYSSQRGSPKKSAASRHGSPQKGSPQKGSPKKTMKDDEENHEKDGGVSISSHSPQPPQQEITEHIVKSPPEPTRVKSPEQIIMRSPDPVNWTVPLDTGKTFTVTQNVKDGENFSRPQSEVKASTPVERPPPAPQSAPPELAQQAKMEAWKNAESKEEKIISGGISPTSVSKKPLPEIRYDKPVPGSTLRCLDDPSFESDPATIRSTAADVLEKARDRFDRFWGGSKEENV